MKDLPTMMTLITSPSLLLLTIPSINSFIPSSTFLLPQQQQQQHGQQQHGQQQQQQQEQPLQMLSFADSVKDIMSGTSNTARQSEIEQYLSSIEHRVQSINDLEPMMEELDDDELASKTMEFRKRLDEDGEDLNGVILEEAFAVVREASWRILEQRHYDVQILAGLILHSNRLAEMKTGEGKTLVSTLPIYLNSISQQTSPSFVITVNDYLARRDMEKMGQIFKFLGLTVGLIQSGMNEEERKVEYGKDVIYVTHSELGFDYLRDHLALSPESTVLPRRMGQDQEEEAAAFDAFCVVDEADSVLIDEARTPLIISKQVPAPESKYRIANTLGEALKRNVHYTVDEKNKNVILNERGYRDAEDALGIKSLFESVDNGNNGDAWAPYVMNAIKAKELFVKDRDYSVLMGEEGEMVGVGIIDSFTGRVLDGRRWSDGLHQSIEAKEGIKVSSQSQVIAKVTYQSLFRQFTKLSGMTGTALPDALELQTTYNLLTTPIPTALPIARRDYPDATFKTRIAANRALVREVLSVGGGNGGRPCLIGTTSVADSEILVQMLKDEGGLMNVKLLNANKENVERESEIVSQAGRVGMVTVATNMAGRGTDILLGGCGSTMARLKLRAELVGLLKGGEVKPLNPDEDYYPMELEDDTKMLVNDAVKEVKKAFNDGLSAVGLDEILTVATDTTEDEENDPLYITKLREAIEAVKETYRPILAKEKEQVVSSGGLYVMGTNRHESRRIDDQLRGRSGRQGDPGSSRFFLSFEDEMFVVFGGDSMSKMLDAFRISDDMPVESPRVTEALDKVQAAVEEKFREIRDQILNFDEALNSQRKVIYKRRQNILFSSMDETMELMKDYNKLTVKDIVKAQTVEEDKSGVSVVNVDKVLEKIQQFFPLVAPVLTKDDLLGMDQEGVTAFITVAVEEVFDAKVQQVEQKAKNEGKPPNSIARAANYITLVSMDNAWSEHLQNMENLKENVVLRKYQNLNPIDEYKREAFEYFKGLEDTMRFNSVYSLWQSLV